MIYTFFSSHNPDVLNLATMCIRLHLQNLKDNVWIFPYHLWINSTLLLRALLSYLLLIKWILGQARWLRG